MIAEEPCKITPVILQGSFFLTEKGFCGMMKAIKHDGRTDMKFSMRIQKLNRDAILPTYGSEYAAGADLYACEAEAVTIEPGKTRLIHTGIAMEIPEGMVGLIYARSGLASKRGLAPANKVGVVDSDYRGEIMVALHNHGETAQTVAGGERIAQMVFAPYYTAEFCEAERLEDTNRGTGGFGSTGK